MGDGRPARSGLTFDSTVIAPRRRGGLLPHPTASAMAHASSRRLTLWPPGALRRGVGSPRSERSPVGVFSGFLDHPAARPALERVGELELLPQALSVLQDDDVLAPPDRLGLVAIDRDLVDLQVDLLALLDFVGLARAADLLVGEAGTHLTQEPDVPRLHRAHVAVERRPNLGARIRCARRSRLARGHRDARRR